MVKCIFKQESGQMVFYQKHLELLMKKHQEANNNLDGSFMMVMLTLFGFKI